ncbi:hypothetical protein Tco_0884586 [Tanacetum coccineum]
MGLKKRKSSEDVSSAAPLASKRSRFQPSPTYQLNTTKMITQPSGATDAIRLRLFHRLLVYFHHLNRRHSPLQGSSVANCLFSPAPQTPSPSTTNKSVSPADNQTPPSMKSVTKCIKVFSPVKSVKSTGSSYETCDADQDKTRLDHDKFKVQNLLKGMQDVMNAYTNATSSSDPAPYLLCPPCFCCRLRRLLVCLHLSPLQGSCVAKYRLFNPAPQTPSPSTTDKSVSPQQQFTSTNRTVLTSETIQFSPMKQVSYYSIERNDCMSSPMKSKRFSTAKGRLAFDGSDIPTSDENTTGSPSEDDAFDFDLPNLDCLAEFLLGDFDDAGPNSVTSVKSVTKCIKVFSPVKTVKSTGLGYETCDADQVVDYIANMHGARIVLSGVMI